MESRWVLQVYNGVLEDKLYTETSHSYMSSATVALSGSYISPLTTTEHK